MSFQEGGIPGLAGIHKSAFNSRIDMVVSLPGDVQTGVHSCRSNPYGYSPCYANATWSEICRDRFDLHSNGYIYIYIYIYIYREKAIKVTIKRNTSAVV